MQFCGQRKSWPQFQIASPRTPPPRHDSPCGSHGFRTLRDSSFVPTPTSASRLTNLSAAPSLISDRRFLPAAALKCDAATAVSAQSISREISALPESWKYRERFVDQPHPPRSSSCHRSCRCLAFLDSFHRLECTAQSSSSFFWNCARSRDCAPSLMAFFRCGMHFHD